MTGPNPSDAKRLSTGGRLAEIAEILAAGLMRLAQKSSPKSADFGESSLAFSGCRGVMPKPSDWRHHDGARAERSGTNACNHAVGPSLGPGCGATGPRKARASE